MTAAAPWYPASCPSWCAGKHPAILALQRDPDADDLDADEVIVHARDLTAADLAASLTQDERHPDSGQPADAAPRVVLWLPDHHSAEGATASDLRRWADALANLADQTDALSGDPA